MGGDGDGPPGPLAVLSQLLVALHVHHDEVVEARHVLLVGGVHDALLRLGVVERVLRVERPLELDADQRHLPTSRGARARIA
eukprot:4539649-Pleurochrysis_carterae.AAC.1